MTQTPLPPPRAPRQSFDRKVSNALDRAIDRSAEVVRRAPRAVRLAGLVVLGMIAIAVAVAVWATSRNDDDVSIPSSGTPIQFACEMVDDGVSRSKMITAMSTYLATKGIDDASTRAATATNVVDNAIAGEGC